MNFYPGFEIKASTSPLDFSYGTDVFGPEPECRRLDDIRKSLLNPHCDGPEVVYAIAMDVGKVEQKSVLNELHLLFGAVTYAAGRLGNEPVRSQGHIHKISPLSGWSTPEVYEIWSGRAFILMQEQAKDIPGKCFAVEAGPGEVVVVPPAWAHATISADASQPLTFGAWCDRAYGFEYDEVRAHKGLAWYPLLDDNGQITWQPNSNYQFSELIVKSPSTYIDLGIESGMPIYQQFEKDPERFLFVPHPVLKETVWEEFVP